MIGFPGGRLAVANGWDSWTNMDDGESGDAWAFSVKRVDAIIEFTMNGFGTMAVYGVKVMGWFRRFSERICFHRPFSSVCKINLHLHLL
jgi:hypothetical protein